MKKFFLSFFLFLIFVAEVQAVIINDLKVKNNDRISKETIATYGQIELNKDYDQDELNLIIKNLYETNFFEDISLNIDGTILILNVVENKIIQSVVVEGLKSKTMTKQILENIFSKDKAPFLIFSDFTPSMITL